MARKREPTGDEYLQHYNAVRIRVIGDCTLNLTLLGFEDQDGNADEQDLIPLVIDTTTRRPLTRLANFRQQRACLEFSVDVIDEYFIINNIMIFHRPIETSYPG